jgi:uncharacterized protein YjbI with pentapeptide repeats
MRSYANRITPGLVVAVIALILALGGTASALPGKKNVDGNDLRKDVVKSKNLVDGQVRLNDLDDDSVDSTRVLDGALRGIDVQDSSLTGADVQDSSLTGADVQDSSLTGADVQDESLTGGDVANDSLTGDDVKESTLQGVMASPVRLVQNQTASLPNGVGADIAVSCPAGYKGIGGGAAWTLPVSSDPTVLTAPLTSSMPVPSTSGTDNITGWRATGRNLSGQNRRLRVYAICVAKQIG